MPIPKDHYASHPSPGIRKQNSASLSQVWKQMMDAYYPNIAWLCLRRDVFEELHRYKVDHGIPSWEQVFEILLADQAVKR